MLLEEAFQSSPVFPGTSGQLEQLEIHHRALNAWRELSGKGRQPGYLRSHIAADNCTSSDCIVEVPVADYARKWDLDLQEYQVHCRYLLIDTKTGYRCNFKKTSFIVQGLLL